ncbi:hypothetical protein CKO28_00125 [Rhodovibrio sodomensis]|uniref:ATPase dynein-related AAA domain-containing protein n=1 Tax=Rhodovibrio sodomensis TaxID=1088 RepID=A0ABS1D7W8_9PROT|nr:AAA family ATPase [Rhodovibrio sodomensis]MBK1666445.1 hypothetical protein [Rhodovibrio sodomensis]
MTTATATKIDGSAITTAVVSQTYNMLLQNGISHDDAVAKLQEVLTDAGYSQAGYTDRLIASHIARLKNGKAATTTKYDASKLALQVYAEITGEAPADDKQAKSAAQTSDAQDAQEEAAVAETETITPAEAGVGSADKSADTGAATRTQAPAFQPSGLAGLSFDAAKTRSLDATLKIATSQRLRSVQQVFDAITEAEQTVDAQEQAISVANKALAHLQAGEVEQYEQIDLGQTPSLKTSGLSELEVDEDYVEMIDMALDKLTQNQVDSYQNLISALKAAEAAVETNAQALREVRREIKANAPKPKVSVNAGSTGSGIQQVDQELDCEVVMRKASDIFSNAYGTTAPILDFEVPTLEWAGQPHPDVPEIDATFRFFAPILADVLHCIVEGEIPWIHGETGCGKTVFYEQLAARLGFPCIRLNFDSHLTRTDVVGKTDLIPGPNGQSMTRYIEGILPMALKMPCLLLFDEFDLGDPEIMPIFQPVLEGKGVRLMGDGGRLVKQHPYCFIGITGNSIGLGCDNQVYLNVHEQSGATRDRISKYMEMPYLPPEIELEVVMGRVPHGDKDFAERVIQLANETRKSYRLSQMNQLVSTRHVQGAVKRHAHFASMYQDSDELVASTLDVTILNYMDDTSRAVARGLVDNLFA